MIYRFSHFEVDTDRFELRSKSRRITVEPLVFDLIRFLVENPDRVTTRDEIIEQVWDGRAVSDATVSSCVKEARKALGDDGNKQDVIRTVRGRGFQFVAELESTAGGGAKPGSTPDKPSDEGRPTEKPTVAILPFENLSADVDEYFADGLTEDIITNLSRFRDLLVIGRTSTFQFKNGEFELSEVSKRLGADYIVQGSVRRAAGRVRITAQLVDAVSGVHLWADKYDREMEDLFAVQDEVTKTIAATLGIKVQDEATQRALKKSRTELDAYDCVLRARRYTVSLTEEMHADARELLERATALDPTNAEAHALLANVYLAEHRIDANPRPDPIGRALKMAETAVELDPQNAYARCWLGIVHFFTGEHDKFYAEVERALALNPNDPETLADVGHFVAFLGDFERGLELSLRARELNPLHPGWYYFTSARYHYDKRQYDEVLADLERIAMPHFYWSHLLRAAALGQQGNATAKRSIEQIYELKPDFSAEAELKKWNAAPGDFEHLMDGLRKAGLETFSPEAPSAK